MKTIEDFKGTREVEFYDEETLMLFRRDEVILAEDFGFVNDENRANFKLFANSYKLLEAADKYTKNSTEENRKHLEQAIQDCL